MDGRLNRFQRAMLDWDQQHPYNAVHVVRIPGTPDLPRLGQVIRAILERDGLTGLSLDFARGTYRYHGGPAMVDVKVGAGSGEGHAMLVSEIECQLNTAFRRGEGMTPFRFFVLPEPESFALGLVYFHPIADAQSIAWLLKDLVETYLGRAAPESLSPVDLYPEPRNPPLFRQPGVFLRHLAHLPHFFRNTRTSSRPRYRDVHDLRNGFTFFVMEATELAALQSAAKTWRVTLNDLLLAAVLKSLAPLAKARRQAQRRKIGVGCIVNVRRDLGMADRRMFGLFLGSFMIAQEAPENLGLEELAGAVRLQTRRIKAGRLYLGTSMQLAFARLAQRLFSTNTKRNFYQKHCPLWGGVTNMNLNTIWDQACLESPVDYLRGVSTGPVTPLVFSVTTVADRVNVGLSYRTTVFSVDEIGQVQGRFVEAVGSLGKKS